MALRRSIATSARGAVSFVCLAVLSALVFPGSAAASDRWTRSFSGFCTSPIVVQNNFVYAGSSDGVLRVFGVRDGRPKWTYSTGRRAACAPRVAHGTVWLSTSEGFIHTLDAFTGREIWVYRPGSAAPAKTKNRSFQGALYVRGKLVQTQGNRLVSVDANTGALIDWLELPPEACSPPAASTNSVLIGASKSVYALSPDTKRVLWRRSVQDDVLVAPATGLEKAYVATTGGLVLSLRLENGSVAWRYARLPAAPLNVATDDTSVFVSTSDGNYYCLDAENGRLRWRFDTQGSSLTAPAASGGSVLFGSNDGRVYSVTADEGKFEWAYETKDEFVASLVVDEETIVLADGFRAGQAARTRLLAFNFAQAISSLRFFSEEGVTGRRADQDAASTFLVDTAIAVSREVSAENSLSSALRWPFRSLSALANPRGSVEAGGRSSRLPDALAQTASVLALTSGSPSLSGFFLLFLLSAAGFTLFPKMLPLLGGAGERAADMPQPGIIASVTANSWMLRVGYAAELSAVPVFILVRLLAGPVRQAWLFTFWTTLLWIVTVLASCLCRSLLLNGLVEAREPRPLSLRRCLPSWQRLFRLFSLSVLVVIATSILFALMTLAAAFNLPWLVPALAVLGLALAALNLADAHLVVAGSSVPRAVASALKGALHNPHAFGAYLAAIAAGLLAPAVAALLADWLSLFAAFLLSPAVAAILAVQSLRIADGYERTWRVYNQKSG